MLYHRIFFFLLFIGPVTASGFEIDQIAIIVNGSHPGSMPITEYYCRKRQVPTSHIVELPMETQEQISRLHYEDVIAPAIRR